LGELQRVALEVQQHLLEPLLVRAYTSKIVIESLKLAREHYLLRLRLLFLDHHHLFHSCLNVDVAAFFSKFLGLYLSEGKQITYKIVEHLGS